MSPISWGGQPGCVRFPAGLDTSIGGLPSSRAIAFIRMRMISKSSAACMLTNKSVEKTEKEGEERYKIGH